MGPKKDEKTEKGKADRPSWKDEEVKALLAIWSAEEIQSQLDGTTRNSKVFSKIAMHYGKRKMSHRCALRVEETTV